MDLAGRVALVTGASSGIGRATAVALARAHAHVLVHGRDTERTAEVAHLVGGTPLLADLAEPHAPDDLAARALAVHGRLDLLVANAGAGLSAPFTAVDPAEIDHLLAVDLLAPIRLVRAVLPAMVERGCGCVVLVSSVAARTGVAGEAVYAAAKAGLDAFAESVRLELTGTGVGVTVLMPGVVDTRFYEARGRAPLRRVPRPVSAEQVADGIVDAVAHDRPEVWVPRWLRMAPMLRGIAPGLFRRLSTHFGEPVRIRGRRRERP
ncbi:MAG TPA: SDR family NAD(P)-dependent oxidoreductase [Nocardioides sp.]|uniref:SDR family NAD(P)-dependent oxidoreductase n=1 Tax=Nocardioides sp. TaxID=35761 RepID=UPI002F416635